MWDRLWAEPWMLSSHVRCQHELFLVRVSDHRQAGKADAASFCWAGTFRESGSQGLCSEMYAFMKA